MFRFKILLMIFMFDNIGIAVHDEWADLSVDNFYILTGSADKPGDYPKRQYEFFWNK